MSQRSFVEPRSHYDGFAEVWLDGVKKFDASVLLTGYVEVTEVTTFSGTERSEGDTSWDGRLIDLSQRGRFSLVQKEFELRLPNGRRGTAVLRPRAHTFLLGTGEPPF
jgi:hypothetical protein